MIQNIRADNGSVVVHIRERIHGDFRSGKNTYRGFDVLKEGIFDDRNRKTKNRNG